LERPAFKSIWAVVVDILLLFVLDSDSQLNKLGLEGGGGESGCKGEGKKVSNSMCIRERACSKKEGEVVQMGRGQ